MAGPLGLGGGGRPELTSTITNDLNTCLLEERLAGRGGYEARVFTSARRITGQWFRTFVDNRGVRVFLTGTEVAGKIVLSGSMPVGHGSLAVRATWEPVGTGQFRQRWETSTNGGGTWKRLLEANYTRR